MNRETEEFLARLNRLLWDSTQHYCNRRGLTPPEYLDYSGGLKPPFTLDQLSEIAKSTFLNSTIELGTMAARSLETIKRDLEECRDDAQRKRLVFDILRSLNRYFTIRATEGYPNDNSRHDDTADEGRPSPEPDYGALGLGFAFQYGDEFLSNVENACLAFCLDFERLKAISLTHDQKAAHKALNAYLFQSGKALGGQAQEWLTDEEKRQKAILDLYVENGLLEPDYKPKIGLYNYGTYGNYGLVILAQDFNNRMGYPECSWKTFGELVGINPKSLAAYSTKATQKAEDKARPLKDLLSTIKE